MNDNYPIFNKDRYKFRIKENSKRGTFVGAVQAHDMDVDKSSNARITYSLFDQSNIPFNIKRNTGIKTIE